MQSLILRRSGGQGVFNDDLEMWTRTLYNRESCAKTRWIQGVFGCFGLVSGCAATRDSTNDLIGDLLSIVFILARIKLLSIGEI